MARPPSEDAESRRQAAIDRAAAQAVTAPKPFDPTSLLSAGSGMAAAQKAYDSVIAQGGTPAGAASSARYTGQAYDYYAKLKAAEEVVVKKPEEIVLDGNVGGGPTNIEQPVIPQTVSSTGNISTAGEEAPTYTPPVLSAALIPLHNISAMNSTLLTIRFSTVLTHRVCIPTRQSLWP